MMLQASCIESRARAALSLDVYRQAARPEFVDHLDLETPQEQNVLRMLIQDQLGSILIPDELEWTRSMVEMSYEHQERLGIRQAFTYLTVRVGDKKHATLTDWHVDGFSMRINHLPEQNYIWCDRAPTEYAVMGVNFPSDFDPLRHNVHKYLASHVVYANKIESRAVYVLDPYMLHRQPKYEGRRCFVRVSFTPIEIRDCNNAENPLLPKGHTYDGLKEWRDCLEVY